MGLFKSIKKGFKKIGKGLKSHFKSIGKGIKSAMGKIGKFMNKIGIVGQLALMFTPVGAMMSNMFSSIGKVAGGMFTKVTGALAKGGTLAQGAGTVLKAAGNFAKAGHAAFKTITEGVSSFIGEFSKTALKKIPGMKTMMPDFLGSDVSDTFFGEGGAWGKVSDEVSKNAGKILDSFNKQIGHSDKILTAGQADLKVKAEAQKAKAATGATDATYNSRGFRTDLPSEAERFGFDSDYGKRIQMEIDAGRSNFTASTSDYVPDQTALDVSKTGKQMVAESGGIQIDKPTFEKQQSLLGRVTDKVTKSYDDWKGEDRTFAEALVDTGVEKVQNKLKEIPDNITGQLETRLYQNVGLQAKPVQNIYQSNAYVPEFNMAPAGQYASADINDRAMQVQLSGGQYHMENPYGFGANDYVRKMAIATGGTA